MNRLDACSRLSAPHSSLAALRNSTLIAAAFVCLLSISAMKSTAQVASQAAAASTDLKLLALEVVSVRPNRSPGSVGVSAGGDGVYIKNIPLRRIVSLAYDFKLRDLVSGLPDWADSEHFDITGKVGQPDIDAFTKLGINSRFLLLQPVLEDRFRMKSHFETREIPVYELVLDKNGPKFTAAEFSLAPGGEHEIGMSSDKGEIRAMGVPLDRFTQALSVQLGRPVIDKTGLTGNYVLTLKWTPDTEALPATPSTPDGAAPADVSGPSIFTAVQEQLGLKLVSTKGPVKILVIDHIERPTEN